MILNLKGGDKVILECKGEQFLAKVSMASSNGRALVILFNAMVDGHLGMMPVTVDKHDNYCSLVNGVPITLRRPRDEAEAALIHQRSDK